MGRPRRRVTRAIFMGRGPFAAAQQCVRAMVSVARSARWPVPRAPSARSVGGGRMPGAGGGLAGPAGGPHLRPLGLGGVRPGGRRSQPRPQHDRVHGLEAAPGAVHRALGAVRRGGAEPVARGRANGGAGRDGAGLPPGGAGGRAGGRGDRGRGPARVRQLAALPVGGQRRAAGGRVIARRDRASPARSARRRVPARRAGRPGAARGVAASRGLRGVSRTKRPALVAARGRHPGHDRPVDRARLDRLGRSAAHLPLGPGQRRAARAPAHGHPLARTPARCGRHRPGAGVDRHAVGAGVVVAQPRPHRRRAGPRRGGVDAAHRDRHRSGLPRGAALPVRARRHLLRARRDRPRRARAPRTRSARPRRAGGDPGRHQRTVRRHARHRPRPAGGLGGRLGRPGLGPRRAPSTERNATHRSRACTRSSSPVRWRTAWPGSSVSAWTTSPGRSHPVRASRFSPATCAP